MQLCRASRQRLRQREPHHFIRLVIGHFGRQSLVCGRRFGQGDIQSQRIEHNLTGGLLHLHGDGFFTSKFLPGNIRIEHQLVMARDNGRGQALRLEAHC